MLTAKMMSSKLKRFYKSLFQIGISIRMLPNSL